MVFGCEEEKGTSDVWLGLLEWEASPFCEMTNKRGRTGLERERNVKLAQQQLPGVLRKKGGQST